MNSEHEEDLANAENSRWPTSAMLLWGTFGTKSPAERRYLIRVCIAAAVTACWLIPFALAKHFRPAPILGSTTSLGVGVLITYVAWEFRRYLLALDELARRMQLEAMAWTYLTGFVVAAWLGPLALLSHTLAHWPLNARLLLLSSFFYFLLEPVRAGWLYYLSRRY
jgi:hypothetical protein